SHGDLLGGRATLTVTDAYLASSWSIAATSAPATSTSSSTTTRSSGRPGRSTAVTAAAVPQAFADFTRGRLLRRLTLLTVGVAGRGGVTGRLSHVLPFAGTFGRLAVTID